MSQQLYDRKIELLIGKPGKQGILYKDLRISFSVEKSSSSVPNKSEVKIYNISRLRRALTEEKGNVIALRAGYGNSVETIFSGDVARSITELDGPDWVTTFEMGDGEKAYRAGKIDQSFSKGTSIKDVFTSMISSLGLGSGDLSGITSDSLIGPLSLSGPVKTHLDDLSERSGAEWSIQNGSVQVIPKGGTTKNEAILLSAETGLIGIPKKKDDGVEVISLLQGKINPGSKIVIKSNVINGNFRVEKVKHAGDNFGQEFYSTMEVVKL